MFTFIAEILKKEHILSVSSLPLSHCRITKAYLLEQAGIYDGSVVIFAMPYYSRASEDPTRNLSTYAVARDYHQYFSELAERLLLQLRVAYPDVTFAAFSDHSPIDERDAAARAGLGVIGRNGLLLTESHSSYVFLGEILLDRVLPYREVQEIHSCSDCGRCTSVCPTSASGICLSALTQKKGTLSSEEEALLEAHDAVWGCDKCQEVCPYTEAARTRGTIYTPIPFFKEQCIPCLTRADVERMTEEEFRARAYSWRGKETILRNLALWEKKERR